MEQESSITISTIAVTKNMSEILFFIAQSNYISHECTATNCDRRHYLINRPSINKNVGIVVYSFMKINI